VGLVSVLAAHDTTTLYPAGIDLAVNGHVHMFQALDFSSGQPVEILIGNGGSQMEGHVDPASAFQTTVAPGAVLAHVETPPGFGFATLDRVADAWELKEWTPWPAVAGVRDTGSAARLRRDAAGLLRRPGPCTRSTRHRRRC
jgi:hypothetical protein